MVFILVQSLLIALSILFMEITVSLLDQVEKERIDGVVKYVSNQIEQTTAQAATATKVIADDDNLTVLLAKGDRDGLIKATAKIWGDLKETGFAQFNFCRVELNAEGSREIKFFYRAQKPLSYNDSASFRPVVMKANTALQRISGIEQGRAGYGFRAVSPLLLDGKHIGSVETGFDMGEPFLEVLDKSFPGNWAIYNLARGVSSVDDRVLVNAIGPDKSRVFENLPPATEVLSRIKQAMPYYELNKSNSTISLYMPVRNYQGDVTAIIRYIGSTNYFERVADARNKAIGICLAGLIVSTLLILMLFRMITSPIKALVLETEKIRDFKIDDPIQIQSSLREISGLVEAMSSMKVGLLSFRKYIPHQLVRQLIESKQEAVVSGQRKKLTVFFSDIADFSTISEKLTPNELASQLSEYLSEMTAIIVEHEGTVDKYIGDSIMAFWGAPNAMQDHATQACLAALKCQEKLRDLAKKWQSEGKPVFQMRIGINTGEMIVGNIGSEQRLSYTVMGDSVNLASRLEGLNKEYSTSIIVSQSTLNELPDDFAFRLLDVVVVKGKTEPVSIYELVAQKNDVTASQGEFLEMFTKAVQSYVAKDWERAKLRFNKLLEIKAGDRACEILLGRCIEFEKNPPSADWEGEYVYQHK